MATATYVTEIIIFLVGQFSQIYLNSLPDVHECNNIFWGNFQICNSIFDRMGPILSAGCVAGHETLAFWSRLQKPRTARVNVLEC